ncbi:PilZ domain-containing protein [Brevibacillus ruminantium]|uniref:PilZ domain-containing protein n=1 Tax=Brevibacillus ruminantium TaxID=2950604 RepID=A0ABY4WAX3_9BACL|nr:PilZ domain-containing protein [Brevibacillus ruminantium]USG64320.1 PilZ domain-containing protein [Brevibacillus ruminantium]
MNGVITRQQRDYFRLKLESPLCSRMTIVMIKGKSLEIGSAEVLIEDIGGGGLRFLSDLKLPVNDQLVLQFETEVFSQQLKTYGHVVRSSVWSDQIYEYAVKFTMDESAHAEINRLVNSLAIRFRQRGRLPSGRFLEGERLDYFANMKNTEQQPV